MTMYMSDHIGEEYEGIISGVTSFGLFAELPNTIEGYIPIESLFGEYTFDETRLRLVGKEDSYAIGERIRIRVVDVDFERRRTLFRLLEKL
jgi:ribonuclease R